MAQEKRGADNRQLTQESVTSEKRLALVIGNGAYQHTKTLPNPPNDAADMAKTLKELGFEVMSGIDQNKKQMEMLIRQFGDRLARQGKVGLFYYAGHGVQVNGQNYLIPIDADIPEEDEVSYASVPVNFMIGKMAAANNDFNIVILDACRNNPFSRSWRGFRDGSTNDGLAEVRPPTGTKILYAARPGGVASDGTGRNGLFTEALLKYIKRPNFEYNQLTRAVSNEVYSRSEKKQVPYEEGSQLNDFYFVAPAPKLAANKQATESIVLPKEIKTPVNKTPPSSSVKNLNQVERESWTRIKNSKNPEDFNSYLKEYPNGVYASFAKNILRELESKTALIPVPSNPVPSKSDAANLADKLSTEPIKKSAPATAEVSGKGDISYDAGFALEKASKYTEAITNYKEAVRLSPENALYHNALGNALFINSAQANIDEQTSERRKEKRNEFLKGMLKSAVLGSTGGSSVGSPVYVEPRYSYFSLPEEAKTHLKEAVRLNPDIAKYHNDLGIAVFSNNNLRRAKEFLNLKGEVDPPRPFLLSNLLLPTNIFDINKINDTIDPITEFRAADNLDPNNTVFRRNLGDALINSQGWSESETIFRELLKIEPNSISHRSKLFESLAGQSKWTDAAPIYIELGRVKLDDDEFKDFRKKVYKNNKELQQEVKKLRR